MNARSSGFTFFKSMMFAKTSTQTAVSITEFTVNFYTHKYYVSNFFFVNMHYLSLNYIVNLKSP